MCSIFAQNAEKSSGVEGSVSGGSRGEDSRDDPASTQPWMQRQLDLYFKGRKRLAEMMGVAQPESLSDDDIAVSGRLLKQ